MGRGFQLDGKGAWDGTEWEPLFKFNECYIIIFNHIKVRASLAFTGTRGITFSLPLPSKVRREKNSRPNGPSYIEIQSLKFPTSVGVLHWNRHSICARGYAFQNRRKAEVHTPASSRWALRCIGRMVLETQDWNSIEGCAALASLHQRPSRRGTLTCYNDQRSVNISDRLGWEASTELFGGRDLKE